MSNVHEASLARAYDSLEGLSVGDAFGETFFIHSPLLPRLIEQRIVPEDPPWDWTDDTNMALSIISVLRQCQQIDQDTLAISFAKRYDFLRGYGMGMHRLLGLLRRGNSWRQEARRLFNNEGSFGNGAAMRVAPLGAYFADDLNLVAKQAILSAEVTHAHPEGIAGAVAVALAASLAWRYRQSGRKPDPQSFLEDILPCVPESEVRFVIRRSLALPPGTDVVEAVRVLGNGREITAQDTVPFALWCAAQHLDSYEDALWLTVSGLGDRDTTCAMVGGIVVMYTGIEGIPAQWRENREPLPKWPFEE